MLKRDRSRTDRDIHVASAADVEARLDPRFHAIFGTSNGLR